MNKKINLFLFLALTSLLVGSGNCYARTHTIVHEGLDLESPLHKVGPDIKALDKMIFEARKKVKLRNKGDNQEANRALYAIRNIIVDRGITYFHKKSPREAIADFDETIRLNPYYAMAYYFRGWAKTIIGLQQEAKKDYETALNLKKAISQLKNYLN